MRPKTRTRLLITILTAAATTAALAQQNFDAVEIKTHPVAGDVYMLEGAGGNIGVLANEEGILIVDDQFAPLAPKIKAALAELSDGELRYVLNTHFHGDHAGGNEIFGLEALIVAHENVRRRLSTEQTARGQTTPPQPEVAWPVITFDHGLAIHFGGEDVHARYAPAGHTDGDSIIYFANANVVHMGDQYFAGRFPFIDVDSGGSLEGYASNVERVIEVTPAGAKIIPGHGPLSTLEDLRKTHEMLVDTIATARAGIEAGKDAEEIGKDGFFARWEGWGSGFINNQVWMQTAVRSLQED